MATEISYAGENTLDALSRIIKQAIAETAFPDNPGDLVLGTDKHDELKNRDLPDQHPISAIEGLSVALEGIDNNAHSINTLREGNLIEHKAINEAVANLAGDVDELANLPSRVEEIKMEVDGDIAGLQDGLTAANTEIGKNAEDIAKIMADDKDTLRAHGVLYVGSWTTEPAPNVTQTVELMSFVGEIPSDSSFWAFIRYGNNFYWCLASSSNKTETTIDLTVKSVTKISGGIESVSWDDILGKPDLSNVYRYKGSVATDADLPSTAEVGDVYNVVLTGMNYAWTGTEWDALGVTFDPTSIEQSISELEKSVTELSDRPVVRTILTEEEFNALPEDERNSGLYFLAKENAGGDNVPSGGGYEKIYSTKEQRIGTWIDGRPLYQLTFIVPLSGMNSNKYNHIVVENFPYDTIDFICKMSGVLYYKNVDRLREFYNVPNYGPSMLGGNTLTDVSEGVGYHYDDLAKRWCVRPSAQAVGNGTTSANTLYITVEYTKTTDEPEVSE